MTAVRIEIPDLAEISGLEPEQAIGRFLLGLADGGLNHSIVLGDTNPMRVTAVLSTEDAPINRPINTSAFSAGSSATRVLVNFTSTWIREGVIEGSDFLPGFGTFLVLVGGQGEASNINVGDLGVCRNYTGLIGLPMVMRSTGSWNNAWFSAAIVSFAANDRVSWQVALTDSTIRAINLRTTVVFIKL